MWCAAPGSGSWPPELDPGRGASPPSTHQGLLEKRKKSWEKKFEGAKQKTGPGDDRGPRSASGPVPDGPQKWLKIWPTAEEDGLVPRRHHAHVEKRSPPRLGESNRSGKAPEADTTCVKMAGKAVQIPDFATALRWKRKFGNFPILANFFFSFLTFHREKHTH